MDELKTPSDAQNKDLSAVQNAGTAAVEPRTNERTTKENGHISATTGAMDELKTPSEAQDKGLSAAVRRDSHRCTAPEQRQPKREQ
jgi:hypothetical protein